MLKIKKQNICFFIRMKEVFKGYVDMELSNVIVAGDFNGESKWGKL